MTLEQIQKLTDDELRVRIAELMGWTHIWRGEHSGILTGYDPKDGGERVPPNYPADLNAGRGFERDLPDLAEYFDALAEICQRFASIHGYDHLESHAITATARQRCEAFLAVMGRE